MAVTQGSLRIVKTFPYRGDPLKEFSNRYYFDGSPPGSSDDWHSLMDAVVTLEKAIYPATVTITQALGYEPGSDVAAASKAYTTAGTHVESGAVVVPGDCAVVLRMATTKRSSKNHPVYVFSYFHSAEIIPAGGSDAVAPGQKTAVENYGNSWLNGIAVSGLRSFQRTTPDGHATTGRFCEPWVGHRDFPG